VTPPKGLRADIFLVERGFAASRTEAQAAIDAGRVHADGKTIAKAAQLIAETARVDYAPAHPYVSRGALKLIAALNEFSISPEGLVCLDIGASTGGFTEVLLERGAQKVFAVDVGHGQLREKLARNPRVVVMEGVNARGLTASQLPQSPQLIVADVSFISLKLALSSALALAKPGARLVALVKPQFEVGRARLGKGGIVKDDDDRRAACEDIQTWLVQDQKWLVDGTVESPIAGGDGNREFLIAAQKP
jgi:23S rRNA (cytidine1920-2'-O)/16S rRNA (cytidine1409-2'-O)-methyltransferase